MLCKSVGKWVGTESPDTVLSPVTFMLFPLLVTSPVSSSVCVFSVASSPPPPVLFPALEPANTRHIFLGFWVKIQSLVTIQISLQVSLQPCLQSPHICPTVLVWLGSALATRLNWESEFLWLMWPVEHHIYSPPMTVLWGVAPLKTILPVLWETLHAATSAGVHSGLLALPRLTCPSAVQCFFFHPL